MLQMLKWLEIWLGELVGHSKFQYLHEIMFDGRILMPA